MHTLCLYIRCYVINFQNNLCAMVPAENVRKSCDSSAFHCLITSTLWAHFPICLIRGVCLWNKKYFFVLTAFHEGHTLNKRWLLGRVQRTNTEMGEVTGETERPDWVSLQYYPACHIQLHSTCFILFSFIIYVRVSIKIRVCVRALAFNAQTKHIELSTGYDRAVFMSRMSTRKKRNKF